MRLLLKFARAHPRRSLVTLGCLLLAGLAEGIGLSSLLPLLDLAVPAESSAAPSSLATSMHEAFRWLGLEPSLEVLLALIVGGTLLKAVLLLLANRQVGYTVSHVATDLRLELIRALLGARWHYYTRQPVGAIANAFATEAEGASQAYLRGTLIVAAAIQAAVYTGIALLVSWQATLAAVAIGALTLVTLHRLVRAARHAGSRQTHLLKDALGRLADTLHAVKPLKAMAREALMGPLLEREARLLDRAIRGEVLSKEGLKALQEPILVTALACGLYLALSRWGLPLATLLMLALLFYRTLSSVNKIQREHQAMAAREAAYWSLRETIDRAQEKRESDAGGIVPTLEKEIVLDGVSLSYDGQTVLKDVDLVIGAGELTALVGPSGAGKTSLADLVIGLVAPDGGEIRVDGVPLRDVDLRRWRSMIGYVPQEMFLLHDSVMVNVTLGDPALGPEDVWSALRDAGAEDFVKALPAGIDSFVGERGSLLSGGQRQRIAIARALAHRPRLLILDEATTALDPATEAAVCDAVGRLRGTMTVLSISHQRALVDLADRVYRVENGSAKPL